MMTAGRRVALGPLLPLVSVALGLAVWELAGQMEVSSALPPFSRVASAIVEVWSREQFRESFLNSFHSVAIAFPIAVASGIVVGLLMGRFRLVEWMFDIYINIFLSLPLVALVPVLLLIFGLGRDSIIAVILIYTFFVVVINTFSGVRTADRNLVEMARSFSASELQIMRRIILPSALPLMLTGIRIAVGRAIKGVIIAEQIIGLVGLGGIIQRYGGAFQVEELYAVILFVGLLGLTSMETVHVLEGRLLPWLKGREIAAA